jgi:hypothetical protein
MGIGKGAEAVVAIEQADPTTQLVDYIEATRHEHLPAHVVAAIKKSFLDTIGAGIAGRSTEIGRIVSDMPREAHFKRQNAEHCVPFKIEDGGGAGSRAAPSLGEHSDEILRNDLGFSAADIAALRQGGTIRDDVVSSAAPIVLALKPMWGGVSGYLA